MDKTRIDTGKVTWQSPSNIALVKYWGKKGLQLPANPSVSLTLARSVTVMEIAFMPGEGDRGISMEFTFEGKENGEFEEKIGRFLQSQIDRLPFLEKLHLRISSRNTFPHSAGIASSASSMSALALCLLSLEKKVLGLEPVKEDLRKSASDLARQASGSACRSLYGGYTLWGRHDEVTGSDDRYAIPLPVEIHQAFRNMQDSILMVSSAKKCVSSRTGHGLMVHHPFADARYAMASMNATGMVKALNSGDMVSFIRITEQEALTLHSLMMSSEEPFLLLKPNSIQIIEKVWEFRKKSGIPVCFTIDAGPNIHLLYPGEYNKQTKAWIGEELTLLLEDGKWIDDHIGAGPENLNEE
jgi:diphosphomevalonate decarboxylase